MKLQDSTVSSVSAALGALGADDVDPRIERVPDVLGMSNLLTSPSHPRSKPRSK